MERPSVRCLCCGYRTLRAPGAFELCPVCWWQDDGQDDADADLVRGVANGALSLTAARASFLTCGACDASFVDRVRSPLPMERMAS